MINKIIFHSKHGANHGVKQYLPQSVKRNIPEWYKVADKYKKKPDGLYLLQWYKKRDGKMDVHKVHSWKSCPAILDTFTTGYYLFTPCDIEIKKIDGLYSVSLAKEWTKAFCDIRGPEEGFPTPPGYEDTHFFWTTNWFPTVPEGYTVLFTHPINRYDLDFLTITGFADCESFNTPGRIPFFIRKDFEGIIPAGTPYAQVIPFKNEKWQSEINDYDPETINQKYIEDNIKGYGQPQPEHGVESLYKNKFWLKKEYE